MPSTVDGPAGCRLTHRVAFPFQSAMASRWKRCRVVSGGGIPKRCPWRRPILFIAEMASWLHPPRVSTTRGMNAIPAARQVLAWAAIFLSSPTCRACPGVMEAPTRVCCCMVEMTCTSKAAGRPLFQVGR